MQKIIRLNLDDYIKSAGYKSVEDFIDFFIDKSNPYDGLFLKNKTPYFDITDDGGGMCLDLVVYRDNEPENDFVIKTDFGAEDFECCASYFQLFDFHNDDIYENDGLYKRLYKITSYYDAPLKELIGYYGR